MTAREFIAREIAAARAAIRNRTAIGAARSPGVDLALIGTPAGAGELAHQVINVATAATHTIIQGTPGARVDIYELMLWNVGKQNLEYYDGADSLDGPLNSFPKESGIMLTNVGEYRFRLQPGNSFRLKLSAATQVSGHVLYRVAQE